MNAHHIRGRVPATLLILIAAFGAGFGLWFGSRMLDAPATVSLQTATLFPQPRALPDFQLTRSTGEKMTLANWKGHWTIAYFGYTNCPDVCPTTLAAFARAWKLLDAPTAKKLRFDFVSVDPARDTPAQLARYVHYFNKDFGAATGSDQELTRLTHALGLVYSHEKAADGSDVVDHSAATVLIDPQGREAGLLRPPFEPAKIAADLKTLAGAP